MTRLSSYAGAHDTTTSPERQLESCEAYAHAKGWTVVSVIEDLDVSASDKGLRLERPGLIEARKHYHEADVLVVPKLDRLARNVADFMAIVGEARDHGVDVVLVAEGLDLTTASGRFIAQILAAFAELEAATISQRTLEAVAYLAREGRHRGGVAPFGWCIVPLDDSPGYRLALDPREGPSLRDAVALVLDGKPLRDVCDEMTARKAPGPGNRWTYRDADRQKVGHEWDPAVLRRLLRRPIMRGMQKHRGEVVLGADGMPIRPHEPMVTDAEWRRLDSALARGNWSPAGSAAPHLLLRGLVTCAYCTAKLHSVTQAGKAPVWVCSRGRKLPDGGRCPGVAVTRRLLEEHMTAEALRVCGSWTEFRVTEEERTDDEAAETAAALDLVMSRLRDADDDAEAVLLDQRRALRARLRDLQARPVLRDASETLTGRVWADAFATADEDGKADLLRSVLAFVAVSKGKRGRNGLDTARLEVVWNPAPLPADWDDDPAASVVFRPTM
jgi:site-specific DNA recombinase